MGAALQVVPRGPVVSNPKSGTLDYADGYSQRLKSFREGAREQALRELKNNREWARLSDYIRCLEGEIWSPNRPRWRSKFVDNHLSRARKETLAAYMNVKPMITVRGPQEFAQHADILTKICVHQWITNDMHVRLAECLDHAMFSVGYWKVQGSSTVPCSVIACGMDTVMPINCSGDIQSSSAVLYRTFKPISYFLKWGQVFAEKVVRSNRSTYRGQPASTYNPNLQMTEYSWSRLSPAMRYVMRDRAPEERTEQGRQSDTFPVGELEEFWVEDYSVNELSRSIIIKDPTQPTSAHNFWYEVAPGERLYPRKRLVVFGGDDNCYDGPSPYWTDQYPFSMLVLDPVVWAPGGLSKYRTLSPLNQGMNEISTGIFDTVRKAIYQAYVAKRGSVSPADWDRFFPEMPNQRIWVNATGNVNDVHALPPPNLPSYVMDYGRYLLQQFDRHANSMDTSALMKKKQVPGGDTLEQMRDSQSGATQLEGQYIEAFLRASGKLAVSHILQFCDKNQRYAILGNDGVTWEDYDWRPNDMIPAGRAKQAFWKLFSVLIAQGSLHGANKDRDLIKAVTLFKAGALSMRTLLTKADIGDVDKEMAEIEKEHKAGMVPAGGRTPRANRSQRTGGLG